ncbi:MAG: LacI family DNA-binding transcriptional regulator [Ruminococcus sp.]|jgi:LacI family transcriptional regulator|uniref:Transcriptional regulator, LacI family n=1 Tax=Ruminococcus albus TaxID=1264 RepID=A0A1H7FCC6_RUMAL|nr:MULTISPECIES: LacI family DNA-binding transcriptional regulator [Ruminococcus]MBO4866515.1 LacI family DNA-binding transcriptional regulator [Ruminococcus sp.]MCR5541012.1 LacI family DNA-binding transcriptional regulator [Ruminococcus sp.]SEK20895.1 transcriptional regulator, LacI family [Ruminococcus albus]SFB76132.1 transcriptional regulator, LacI family [Ruminococcus albus]
MKKPVTLIDIAKACNTSNVTVSKALADKSGVSDELRAKIKQVAEEMGYVPSKTVTSRKKSNIGVLIPEKYVGLSGSFYWTLYNSLVQRLKRENLYCVIENLEYKDEENLVLPNIVTDRKISALISLGEISHVYAQNLSENVEHLILLDYYVPGLKVDSIVTNGYNGGYKLANYLISLGHRRIGFIGSKKATSSIFDRYMGYLKALIEHDLEIRDDWIIDDRDKYSDPIDLVFPKDMPTAFVCNCDEVAFQTIKQLREHGYSVPEDVSVVGYDNYLISEVSDPTITTISIDAEYMAELTVNTLIQRLNDPSTIYRMRTIEGDLVIKNSVLPLNR